MLKHTDLFEELPEKYYDSAFLDRLHFYIPGWEVDIIRGEMFSDGYGFVVDYLAEVLRTFRNHDYSQRYGEYFELLSDISTRDRDAINKTFSGLMKILFPHGETTEKEIEEVLRFAIEGRKRIKMQLMRIDPTYAKVRFGYIKLSDGKEYIVRTLEEKEYPQYFELSSEEDALETNESDSAKSQQEDGSSEELKEQHLTFQENQRGVSFNKLFGPYIKGAGTITITDPYIRLFFQARNLMELLETIGAQKPDEDEIEVHLLTIQDEFKAPQQIEYFVKIQESCAPIGIKFTWEFDKTNSIHARHIVTDHGWKILLDRGLDIFQHYEMNNAFAISNRIQRYRACKAFEATFIKI